MEDIKREAALARESTGTPALGLQAILSQDPHHRPEGIAKSPAPFVHAASKAARLALYQSYAWFVAAFREAAEKLRRGDPMTRFPASSFPPAPALRSRLEERQRPEPWKAEDQVPVGGPKGSVCPEPGRDAHGPLLRRGLTGQTAEEQA